MSNVFLYHAPPSVLREFLFSQELAIWLSWLARRLLGVLISVLHPILALQVPDTS